MRYPRCYSTYSTYPFYPYGALYYGGYLGYGAYLGYGSTSIYEVQGPTYIEETVVTAPTTGNSVSVPNPVVVEASPTQDGQQPSDDSGGTDPLEPAHKLFAGGEYERARELYLQSVLGDARDGYARLLYGLSSFALADFGNAVKALRGALNVAPELVSDPIDIREFYLDPAQFNAQLDALFVRVQEGRGAADSTDHSDLRFLLGYLLFASAQPERADPIVSELRSESPNDEQVKALHEALERVLKSVRP